ncbi:MAG TPA: glycosyltransferase family 4 protein [Pyrinomonadaceae bacterium]|jgi:glycosyltransferase involved in cell wall biosynthesis
MRLLFALTYYHPHISGLTIVVERLAEALAARGHEITVITSQHRSELPLTETHNGVHVVRVPVAFRISKGALMPSYAKVAASLLRRHDAVLMNLPNTPVEATVLSFLCRLVIRRPLAVAYHCDLKLSGTRFSRVINEAVFLSNVAAGLLSQRVVAATDDYANHSRFLRLFETKRETINYLIRIPSADAGAVAAFRRRHAPRGQRLIGFAGRIAAEKGVEYLMAALPHIRAALPDVKILLTGDPRNVIGEEAYWRRIAPSLAEAREHVEFLGTLDWQELAAFYAACDVTVLPSVNSTESFGLVQLESMLCGTPVVASDLPGVRVPVQTTGMGRIVAPRDEHALADALLDVIRRREHYVRPRAEIEKHFAFDDDVRRYEALFERLLDKK